MTRGVVDTTALVAGRTRCPAGIPALRRVGSYALGMARRPVLAVVVVAGLAAVAGACGGGGSKAASTTTTTLVTTTTAAPPVVAVDPASGPVGTVFTFRVSQLKPGDPIVFKLAGPKNYAFQGTAHPVAADGTVSAQYHATANNPAGAYTVHATANGQDAATGTFTIGTATAGTTKTTKATSPTTKPAVTTTKPAVTTTKRPVTTTIKP